MPFDVLFNIAHDQQHVLLEQSKPQGVGNSDLFRGRFLARASRAVEQIYSRLCPLSALFTLFSNQTCAADLSSVPCRGSPWNSTILFSSTKRAVAISFESFVGWPTIWSTELGTDQGRGGVDSKSCNGNWLGTDAGINRPRNSGRARGSSNPSRRKAKRSDSLAHGYFIVCAANQAARFSRMSAMHSSIVFTQCGILKSISLASSLPF